MSKLEIHFKVFEMYWNDDLVFIKTIYLTQTKKWDLLQRRRLSTKISFKSVCPWYAMWHTPARKKCIKVMHVKYTFLIHDPAFVSPDLHPEQETFPLCFDSSQRKVVCHPSTPERSKLFGPSFISLKIGLASVLESCQQSTGQIRRRLDSLNMIWRPTAISRRSIPGHSG